MSDAVSAEATDDDGEKSQETIISGYDSFDSFMKV